MDEMALPNSNDMKAKLPEGNKNFDAPEQYISGEFHLLSSFKDKKHSRSDGS